MKEFDYQEAFSRNVGWVTQQEQQMLKRCKVAIAGLGGVGGDHLITLTRLGIEHFSISDLDDYELANFNRQAGATMQTLGQPKLMVTANIAKGINPNIDLDLYPTGISEANVDAFLEGADLYVDSLDLFAVKIRSLVFRKCREKGIPAITAAPLGTGTSMLCFMPKGLSFHDYFGWHDNLSTEEAVLRFLVGLAPRPIQLKYLVDPTKVDLFNHKAPSTPMGIHSASAIVGTYALKMLLGRGKVLQAPHSLQIDPYLHQVRINYRPFGYHNPLQRLMLKYVRRRLLKS